MIGSIIGYIAGALRDPHLEQLPHLEGESFQAPLLLEMFAAADTFLNSEPLQNTQQYWHADGASPSHIAKHHHVNALRSIPTALFSDCATHFRASTYLLARLDAAPHKAMQDAMATSMAIYWARTGCSKIAIQSQLEEYFQYDMQIDFSHPQITPIQQKNRPGCVPGALDCALEALSYRQSIWNAVSIGQGEKNPALGAITGALAESRFGVPSELCQQLLQHLPEKMRVFLRQLYSASRRVEPRAGTTRSVAAIATCLE